MPDTKLSSLAGLLSALDNRLFTAYQCAHRHNICQVGGVITYEYRILRVPTPDQYCNVFVIMMQVVPDSNSSQTTHQCKTISIQSRDSRCQKLAHNNQAVLVSCSKDKVWWVPLVGLIKGSKIISSSSNARSVPLSVKRLMKQMKLVYRGFFSRPPQFEVCNCDFALVFLTQ